MSAARHAPTRVVALSGGIGGAKLALGLCRTLEPGALTVIANTADDFVHMGLHVSPDIDTLLYTLAGLANTELGWGRADETWNFMAALASLGGETWFNLGDRDLAMHVSRTARLAQGESLTAITKALCTTLGVGATILPMSDQPVRTRLQTSEGWLDFQDYFVRRQAKPTVREITYAGIGSARASPEVISALTAPGLAAIIICPSNPLISIEPILAVPGIREALTRASAPILAVSPIIDGRAVKGPTAKMLEELGDEATAAAVLGRYDGLLDAYIVAACDLRSVQSAAARKSRVSLHTADIMMVTLDDRDRLARAVMDVAANLPARADNSETPAILEPRPNST